MDEIVAREGEVWLVGFCSEKQSNFVFFYYYLLSGFRNIKSYFFIYLNNANV